MLRQQPCPTPSGTVRRPEGVGDVLGMRGTGAQDHGLPVARPFIAVPDFRRTLGTRAARRQGLLRPHFR